MTEARSLTNQAMQSSSAIVFDKPVEVTDASKITVSLDANDALYMPQKPHTPAKKVITEAVKPADEVSVIAPILNYGIYTPVGPTFPTFLRNYIRGIPEQKQIFKSAIADLAKKGFVAPNLIMPILSKTKVEVSDPADPSKKVIISKLRQYRETENGRNLIGNFTKRDAEVRSLRDSLVKAYVKSESGRAYYEKWLTIKNSDMMSEDIFYILCTIVKYNIAALLHNCVKYRMGEIQKLYNSKCTQRTFSSIIVNNNTLMAFCEDYYKPGSQDPKSVNPFMPYLISRIFAHRSKPEFIEPQRKNGAKEEHVAEEEETPATREEDEEDEEEGENKTLINLVNEVFRHKISLIRQQIINAETGATPAKITTTHCFKAIIAAVMLDFCTKTIDGISLYEQSSGHLKGRTAVTMRFEHLSARLQVMAVDHAVPGKENDVLKNVTGILEKIYEDYSKLEEFRAERNIAKTAQKKGTTVEDLKKSRDERRIAKEKEEDEKEALAAGKTLEDFIRDREEKRKNRSAKSEEVKARKQQEVDAKLARQAEKLKGNEKKWAEKQQILLEKYSNFIIPEPPSN